MTFSKSLIHHMFDVLRAGFLALVISGAYVGAVSASEVESIVMAIPYFKHGEHQGFVLYPKSESDLQAFEGIGFETGDILVKVDGQKLVNPPAPVELYEPLARGDAVVVIVSRNDKLVEFSIRPP